VSSLESEDEDEEEELVMSVGMFVVSVSRIFLDK
jgi:hypothetical protein